MRITINNGGLALTAINLRENLFQLFRLIHRLKGSNPTETAIGVVKTAQTELVPSYSNAIDYIWIDYDI